MSTTSTISLHTPYEGYKDKARITATTMTLVKRSMKVHYKALGVVL